MPVTVIKRKQPLSLKCFGRIGKYHEQGNDFYVIDEDTPHGAQHARCSQ